MSSKKRFIRERKTRGAGKAIALANFEQHAEARAKFANEFPKGNHGKYGRMTDAQIDKLLTAEGEV